MPGLGRLRSTDVRNAAFLMHRTLGPVAALKVPDNKTWAFSGQPLNQGETGTCVAHAMAHFIHAAPLEHKKFLNAFDLYRELVLLDEYADNDVEATRPDDELQMGSSGTGGMKALRARNLIESFLWAQRMEDAITWVLTRGPVAIGSNWYNTMFDPTKEGYLRIGATAGIAGGHEWIIRGADKKRGLALMVNSWGPEWGSGTAKWQGAKLRGGHALIDFDTLARLFHEEGDAVSGIEKKAA